MPFSSMSKSELLDLAARELLACVKLLYHVFKSHGVEGKRLFTHFLTSCGN